MTDITVGHRLYAELQRQTAVDDLFGNPLRPPSSIFGMRVQANPMFPYRQSCATCDGTGEGHDSTYCRTCKGAGAMKVQGIMTDGREVTLLTSPLPRRFEPRVTFSVPAMKLCRGIA